MKRCDLSKLLTMDDARQTQGYELIIQIIVGGGEGAGWVGRRHFTGYNFG